jgi:hypothetical protein
MIHFQPFGQAMSIADTGASAVLRAGSRRAYHPGVGWNLGAAKSCMFQNLGPEDLYPAVRTRLSVVFGDAFFDSTDGGHLAY